jgi:nucleotide-binding universal stress UspA family protein
VQKLHPEAGIREVFRYSGTGAVLALTQDLMKLKSRIIVVGVDFSELADTAFRQAYDLAVVSSVSEIHAIFVMPAAAVDPLTGYDAVQSTSAERMEAGAAQLTAHVNALLLKLGGIPNSGMRVYSHFRVDVPWIGITRLATEVEANFVVVGTHGRHGVARWLLGSVVEGVVRHAPCPVLVIPLEAPIDVPKIEPACSMCIDARKSSKGRDLWCVQHRTHHGRRHTFHQRDRMSEDSA